MSLITSLSGPKPSATGKPRSLARHIFVRVAFPAGILFVSCFSLVDQLVQRQLREHIQQELLSWDLLIHRANVTSDVRLRRSLEAVATANGLPQTLQRLSGSRTPDVLALLGSQLTKLGLAAGDEDFVALAGVDRVPVLALQRQGASLLPVAHSIPVEDTRTLTAVNGSYYFLTSHPLHREGALVGWLLTGRRWAREMPFGDSSYLVSGNHRVVEFAGTHPHATFTAGMELPPCPASQAVCEVQLNGQPHLVLRSAASPAKGGIEIFLVQSVDLIANPLLGLTRSLVAAGAILIILGAFGLTLLTERAISRPLKDIADSCVRAQDSGHPLDIHVPQCRIHEVNTLGQTLQAAVRSIEDGQSRLTQAYFQFMGAIVALLDARDAYTAGHSHRVSAYSEALARDFGLPHQQIDDIRIGALLHDIGKIGVPDEVLRKHERLTKEEFDLMKQHPTIGRKVLEQIVQFEKYLDAVELHHENLDGTGYPRGLRGEQIPISARIVKVADVYDALSTDRPYRKRMPREKVHAILREGAGTQFDRLLVEIFLTRSVPSFELASGLEQLHRALGEVHDPVPARKQLGA